MSSTSMAKPRGFARPARLRTVVATLLVTLVSIAAILVWAQRHRGPATSVSQVAGDAELPVLAQAASGDGWTVSRSASYRESDFIISLRWQTAASTDQVSVIDLTDPGSGQPAASIQVRANPLVVRRRAAHQLLVSDAGPESRLLVFDTAHDLALTRQIPLPNRSLSNAYAPYGMVVSTNDRYLFYLTHRVSLESPECAATRDSAVCDRDGVAVLDLDTSATAAAALPGNCGSAVLHPTGPASVVAACTNIGTVQELDAQGRVTSQVTFDEKPLFGFRTPNGQLAIVSRTGSVLSRDATGAVRSVNALPKGARINPTSQQFQLDPSKLLLTFLDDGAAPDRVGAVVFNLASMAVERTVPPGETRAVVPRGGSDLLLLRAGALDAVSLSSGSRTGVAARIPTDAVYLIP